MKKFRRHNLATSGAVYNLRNTFCFVANVEFSTKLVQYYLLFFQSCFKNTKRQTASSLELLWYLPFLIIIGVGRFRILGGGGGGVGGKV